MENLTCRYLHCKHKDQMIMPGDPYVLEGKMYYHKDCFEQNRCIKRIEQYYIDNFDKYPIMQVLRKVINTLVIDRGEDPEYILFALKYAKQNNLKLKHPPGIYYLLKNTQVEEAWSRYKENKAKELLKDVEFKAESRLDPVEGYNKSYKPRGFQSILR